MEACSSRVQVYISQPLPTGAIDTGPWPTAYTENTCFHTVAATPEIPHRSITCVCVHGYLLCGKERQVCACVSVCQRNAFIMTEQSRTFKVQHCPSPSFFLFFSLLFFLSLPLSFSISRSQFFTNTHFKEHTWGIPGHFVIGLNDLRNNKRPFSFLV